MVHKVLSSLSIINIAVKKANKMETAMFVLFSNREEWDRKLKCMDEWEMKVLNESNFLRFCPINRENKDIKIEYPLSEMLRTRYISHFTAF